MRLDYSSILKEFVRMCERFTRKRSQRFDDYSDMHNGGQNLHNYAWRGIDHSSLSLLGNFLCGVLGPYLRD